MTNLYAKLVVDLYFGIKPVDFNGKCKLNGKKIQRLTRSSSIDGIDVLVGEEYPYENINWGTLSDEEKKTILTEHYGITAK